MNDEELKKLYEKIEKEIESLEAGTTKHYEAPEFTASELMTIAKIVEHLQKNKFNGTIQSKSFPLRTVVTKLDVGTPIFSNLTFEKSEEQVLAEEAYNKCITGEHKLTLTDKTTFKNPLLVCQQCKVGYTFKLNSGIQKVSRVIKL
ncbi:hypothetical protein QVL04_004957 [Escherichia coli]|nr:hypothetical protein [Escherichia coli]